MSLFLSSNSCLSISPRAYLFFSMSMADSGRVTHWPSPRPDRNSRRMRETMPTIRTTQKASITMCHTHDIPEPQCIIPGPVPQSYPCHGANISILSSTFKEDTILYQLCLCLLFLVDMHQSVLLSAGILSVLCLTVNVV